MNITPNYIFNTSTNEVTETFKPAKPLVINLNNNNCVHADFINAISNLNKGNK
jgi:hypothetical protein